MAADNWNTLLMKLALKADFQTAIIAMLDGAPPLPENAVLWRSTYAELLAVPVGQPTDRAIRDAIQLGQEWLDLSCMVHERNYHCVMDAYLVIISTQVVPEELFPAIQEIELDPTTCRKHIVWPHPGTDDEMVWRRLFRITSLGLPPSPQATGMTDTPVLQSNFQKNVLDDVKAMKGRAAARQHAERSPPDNAP